MLGVRSGRRQYSASWRGVKAVQLAAIEEALLVRELVQGLGLSQREVARRSGHDISWVSRRLQLLAGLPDAIVVAVIEGRLSSWAASRVVAPLARATASTPSDW
jgi:ParB family transcriptional regulator, chromosome partitioning protein